MRQVTPISLTDEKIGKIEVNNWRRNCESNREVPQERHMYSAKNTVVYLHLHAMYMIAE